MKALTFRNILPFILLVAWGCNAGIRHLEEKSLEVQPGQTYQQVSAIMGVPGDRQFEGSMQAWQYCSTSKTMGEGDHYVVVWFYQGRVTGLTTYKNHRYGRCSSFFRTVRWEDAPDVDVRIRNENNR